jgi:hypothetical protein
MNTSTCAWFRPAWIATLSTALIMPFALSAHATVLCVSTSGKVPPSTAKNLGCAATVFTKIGTAVAAASPGDTVAVFPGTYGEMVTINLANLQLLGMNPKRTIIDATGQANGVLDMASGVVISGFTVENASREGILVTGPPPMCMTNGNGVLVCTPSAPVITNVTVSNNIVTDNDKGLNTSTNPPTCAGAPDADSGDCGEAIHIDGVDFSTVSNNMVKHNAGGILLTDETNENTGNLVNGNDVESNTPSAGIALPSHPPGGNTANATAGARSFGLSEDTVANNISKANGAAGIGIFAPTVRASSRNHLVAGNTLANNTLPGISVQSHGTRENVSGNRIVSNIISSNGADPVPGSGEIGPSESTGIEVFADLASDPVDVDIAGNTISKETNSIWVGAMGWNNCPDTTPCYTPLVHLNNLIQGTTGIFNAADSSASQVITPENFWGCPKGPNQKGCTNTSGNVTSVPFLIKPSKLP